MSPENTHKLMGFHMEVLIGVILRFCFFKLFPIGLYWLDIPITIVIDE